MIDIDANIWRAQTSALMSMTSASRASRPRVFRGWGEVLSPPPLLACNGLADWSLENAIRRHVAEVLRYTAGDQQWAADELGVNPSTVHRWLKSWALDDSGRCFRPLARARRRHS